MKNKDHALPNISVVVCTVGRDTLPSTIESIQKNTYKKFEIVLVSQAKRKIHIRNKSKVRIYSIKGLGLSRARNFGIGQSKGDIIAFTDDDCEVDSSWLSNIANAFLGYTKAVGIFGRSLPKNKKKHPLEVCPCVFPQKKSHKITRPVYHAQSIGYGNNMAFKKELFSKYGTFKEWLGQNSIGESAEDAEWALRLLTLGERLFYRADVLVYHNRWLSKAENDKVYLTYLCGELSCYSYFSFQGYGFASAIVRRQFYEFLHEAKSSFRHLLSLHFSFYDWRYCIQKQSKRMKGILVGLAFFLIRKEGNNRQNTK